MGRDWPLMPVIRSHHNVATGANYISETLLTQPVKPLQ